MVYESDFYTSRRPYSSYSSRPYVSSYSVTPLYSSPYLLSDPYYIRSLTTPYYTRSSYVPFYTRSVYSPYYSSSWSSPYFSSSWYSPYVRSSLYSPYLSSSWYSSYNPYYRTSYYSPYITSFARTIPHLPYVAHKRLVSVVHTSVPTYTPSSYLPYTVRITSRVRPSVLAAELNRIRYLYRPFYTKSYTDEYLNSRNYLDFDDEAREIRAKTDSLLRRIHVFVPRPSLSQYDETSPERLRSDDFVRRILNAKHTRQEIESLPWYTTPEKREIGEGHLACLRFAGGRPQSKRRPYYTVGDLVPGDVKSDVHLMSYYLKNRKAAEDACGKPDKPAPSWRDRVPELYQEPTKPKVKEEEVEVEDEED